MTAPLPPTAGPVPLGDRLDPAFQEPTGPDIQAPLPDLAGAAADAESAGKAWCAGAGEWADSPQGAGSGGFTLTNAAAAGEWDSNVAFPHQGP